MTETPGWLCEARHDSKRDEPFSSRAPTILPWKWRFVWAARNKRSLSPVPSTSSVLVTHNLYHAFTVCCRFVVISHGAKVFEAAKQDTITDEVADHFICT